MKLAFVFPGQGSQSLGMLAEMAVAHPIIETTFAEASAVLGFDLWKLTQQGPITKLNKTALTQPALLTASVALWRIWQAEHGALPHLVAGHSLGEYSALVCAGALDFCDAVKLVQQRGQFMQQAVNTEAGTMAAIIGLTNEQVTIACTQAANHEIVAPANFNSPGQVVIAGQTDAVQRAADTAKSMGARKVIMLAVSVPSHCTLMQPAADHLINILKDVTIEAPQIPCINNVDVCIETNPTKIKNALVRQLTTPVRWVETIEKIIDAGILQIIECGPGRILTGLNKRINKSLECTSLNTTETLAELLGETK